MKILKNFLAIFFGIFISLIIMEMFLRIYTPVPVRLKGSNIILPSNKSLIIKNKKVPGLDPAIVYTINSLGFRGKEIPKNFLDLLSIIVVGGSTTECHYISDSKTWPEILQKKLSEDYSNIWINNAGFDGHSTFGHKMLLENYIVKLKPKYIIYLIGINDIGRNDLFSGFDNKMLKNSYTSFIDFLGKKSSIANFIINLLRSVKARVSGVTHSFLEIKKIDSLEFSDSFINEKLREHDEFLISYKNRLIELITVTRENKIKPILVTQPLLCGKGIDPTTGIDLERIKIDSKKNGYIYWHILELYNNVTREMATAQGIHLIDLALQMPKDSKFYYDFIHFNNEGCLKVADILYNDLTKYFFKN